MPRRRWRHRRRSSGVNEYSTVSSSANSWVDFDGLSEAALASRSAVTIARLLRAAGCGCGIFGSGCGASIVERRLRTVGNLGWTGLQLSVGGTTEDEVALVDVDGIRAVSPVARLGDRCGPSVSLMTT